MSDSRIPERDLGTGTGSPTDMVRVVKGGVSMVVPADSLPIPSAVQDELTTIKLGQGSLLVAFSTVAEMNADLAHPANTPAWVATGTDAEIGTYRKIGASGTGSWVKVPDRVSGLEQMITRTTPAGYYSGIRDNLGYYRFLYDNAGGFGTAEAYLTAEGIATRAFEIGESSADVAFSVKDRHGYYAVHVPATSAGGGSDAPAVVNGAARHRAHTVQYVAHRGTIIGGITPENSLDAYIHAGIAGYTMCETDLVKTADGEFVLMHDATLARTCKNAADYSAISPDVAVSSLTLAQLRANYVLAADNPKMRRPVPTLAEFVGVCRSQHLLPVMELKQAGGLSDADVDAIISICTSALGSSGYALTSFDFALLDYARTVSADVDLWYLTYATSEAIIDHCAAQAPAVLFPAYEYVTADLVAYAHSKGVPVAAWTIPPAHHDRMLKLGVDYFMVNSIAPPLRGVQVSLSSHPSYSSYSSYSHSGALDGGVVTLAEGQTLSFVNPLPNTTEFGAYYLSIDYKGAATLAASRLTAPMSGAADDWETCNYQSLLTSEVMSMTITAGTGGCQIKDVRLLIASWR